MKCPKCHYLSFDPEPRCRNCGHDLSVDDGDLALVRPDEALPLADLTLRTMGSEPSVDARDALTSQNSAAHLATNEPAPARSRVPEAIPNREPSAAALKRPVPPPAPATTELPLFVKEVAEPAPAAPNARSAFASFAAEESEAPMVSAATTPRAPLSVRRKAPDSGPQKAKAPAAPARKLGSLDRDLLEDLQRIERTERREAAAQAGATMPDGIRAGAANRLAAAAVDALFLGLIGTAILWVTLRWLDLPVTDARLLPWLPTGLFMLLMGVTYLVMFTMAGGQTLGKMVMGLRVIADEHDGDEALTMKQATLRSLVAVPSVLALGAGFLPALVGDERALHDRLAHTRVVRA